MVIVGNSKSWIRRFCSLGNEGAATDEMIARVLTGRVQLALVGETEVDDRIELTPFLSDEIVGVARPAYWLIVNAVGRRVFREADRLKHARIGEAPRREWPECVSPLTE